MISRIIYSMCLFSILHPSYYTLLEDSGSLTSAGLHPQNYVKVLNKDYIEIIENPTRENQQYFILNIKDYTWVVPFVIDNEERIVLKNAFPGRKFHKKYGGVNSND